MADWRHRRSCRVLRHRRDNGDCGTAARSHPYGTTPPVARNHEAGSAFRMAAWLPRPRSCRCCHGGSVAVDHHQGAGALRGQWPLATGSVVASVMIGLGKGLGLLDCFHAAAQASLAGPDRGRYLVARRSSGSTYRLAPRPRSCSFPYPLGSAFGSSGATGAMVGLRSQGLARCTAPICTFGAPARSSPSNLDHGSATGHDVHRLSIFTGDDALVWGQRHPPDQPRKAPAY